MKDLIITLVEIVGIIGAIGAYYYYLEQLLKRKLHEKLQLPSGTVPHETFDLHKFLEGMLSCFNVTLWSKDLISLFNIRKLLIYALIIGSVGLYGYYKGNQNVPIKVDLGYGRTAIVNLGNGEYLWIQKSGEVDVIDNANPAKAKILRVIKVKDLGALKAKLSPIGFQFSPIGVVGYSLGLKGDGGIEAGVGISIFRFYRTSLETFITNAGIYGGISYRLDRINLNNSSVGIAVGEHYNDMFKHNDPRVMVYINVKF